MASGEEAPDPRPVLHEIPPTLPPVVPLSGVGVPTGWDASRRAMTAASGARLPWERGPEELPLLDALSTSRRPLSGMPPLVRALVAMAVDALEDAVLLSGIGVVPASRGAKASTPAASGGIPLSPEPASTTQPGTVVWTQPDVGSHVSVVQGSASSQAPQLAHAVAPAAAEKVPSGHATHIEPSLEYVPAPHGAQVGGAVGVHAEVAASPAGQPPHAAHVPPPR
jgi:hypothetical protein